MLRLIIVRFLKIVKSLISLFLSLIIKFIITFSFIFILKKYYSHFKFIFNLLKKFNHYYIFKYFIQSLAIFNILLAGFTIFILTDYQHHDYITLIEQNLYNLNENDLFIKLKKYINKIIKFVNDLFSIENIEEEENNITDKNKIVNEDNKIPKDFYFYFLCFTLFTTFSFAIYNNIIDYSIIITPITNFFSAFFSKLFGTDDDDTPDSGDVTLSDNRSLSTSNLKTETVFYTNETGDKAKALESRLNELLRQEKVINKVANIMKDVEDDENIKNKWNDLVK